MSLLFVLLCASSLVTDTFAKDDILLADFEGGSYGNWKVEGKAFGTKPAAGTLPNQMEVTGFKGTGLANSYHGGDNSTGSLTSPTFKIERQFLNFLIGGGGFAEETCFNLLIDGKVVRTAMGPNTEPGGSEALAANHWNLQEFKGKDAVLRIVDKRTGGWGHINIDHIVQSDKSEGKLATGKGVVYLDNTREINITGKYLLFPIRNGAKPNRMTVSIDGKLVHDFEINLASDKPDWWARMEVPQLVGKKAKITSYKMAEDNKGLDLVEAASEIRHTQPLYKEALRPQLRFSQMQGWNNDPNGMVYYDGEYHLFWQSNPFGQQWNNMYWGHAVSKNLLHWEELPYALYPRVMAKSHCFSGSAHIDTKNTGGWQTGSEKTMVAVFTDTGLGETIAISNDKGRSWKYLDENPVILKRDGRDPKLVWYEPGQHWVIAVYTRIEKKDYIEFYSSKDLKKWEKTSQLEGYFECPELFELPVDGNTSDKRWVLFAADAKYVIGKFDGKVFTPEDTKKQQLHYGPFYASQCFSNVPGGRVIQIGWVQGMELPGMPFNQGFSLPIELRLIKTNESIRMLGEPIAELKQLRQKAIISSFSASIGEKPSVIKSDLELFDLEAEFTLGDAKELHLQLGTTKLKYDAKTQKLDEMPLPLKDGKLSLRIIVDKPMIEVVGQGGVVYKTIIRKDPGKTIDSFAFTAVGGSAKITSLNLFPMNSIWKK